MSYFEESAGVTDVTQVRKVSTARKSQIDAAFMKMIVLDYQPLTVGERAGMRQFADNLLPGYVTPCYATVKDTLLPNAMKAMENKLQTALRDNYSFAIATDIWTSRRGHPFIAFIATFITENFEGKTVLLGCAHMPGRHTAERIHDAYDTCIGRWNIDDRIVRIVSDNASNMLSAFRLPGFTTELEFVFNSSKQSSDESKDIDLAEDDDVELEMTCEEIDNNDGEIEAAVQSAFFTSKIHLSCPIHTLQLAIKDAFQECEEVANVTGKVAKLVAGIRHSALNTTFTDSLGVRPAVACATRWNSQLRMIASVIKLFEKDGDCLSKMSVQEGNKLTASDLRVLNGLVEVLTPLAELTDSLQAEFGSLGAILPSIAEMNGLFDKVKTPFLIRIFAETLGKKFTERFQKYYEDVHLTVAAVLDPRFKEEWIIRDTTVREKVLAIRELVLQQAEEVKHPVHSTANELSAGSPQSCHSDAADAAVSKEKKPRLIFSSYSASSSAQVELTAFRSAREELEHYLSLPRLHPAADVLSFWRENK